MINFVYVIGVFLVLIGILSVIKFFLSRGMMSHDDIMASKADHQNMFNQAKNMANRSNNKRF
jgi:beta-lactamase regulating signal transducer with metallopeptidase domain